MTCLLCLHPNRGSSPVERKRNPQTSSCPLPPPPPFSFPFPFVVCASDALSPRYPQSRTGIAQIKATVSDVGVSSWSCPCPSTCACWIVRSPFSCPSSWVTRISDGDVMRSAVGKERNQVMRLVSMGRSSEPSGAQTLTLLYVPSCPSPSIRRAYYPSLRPVLDRLQVWVKPQ